MADPTFRRASISEILLALQAQIVSITGLDPTAVVITVDGPEEVPLLRGDKDVLIIVADERPDVDAIEGGGRVNNERLRNFEVCCRSRAYLDIAHEDVARLTDDSVGHLVFSDLVVDAAELFEPEDADSNVMGCPMTVGVVTRPRRLKKDPGWVYSSFPVAIRYERKLDQSRQ